MNYTSAKGFRDKVKHRKKKCKGFSCVVIQGSKAHKCQPPALMITALPSTASGLILIKLLYQRFSLILFSLPRALASSTSHNLVWLLCSVLSNFLPTSSVISSLQPLLPRPCCVCVPGLTFSPPFLSGSNTTSADQKPQRHL